MAGWVSAPRGVGRARDRRGGPRAPAVTVARSSRGAPEAPAQHGYWMRTDARFAPPTAFVPSAARHVRHEARARRLAGSRWASAPRRARCHDREAAGDGAEGRGTRTARMCTRSRAAPIRPPRAGTTSTADPCSRRRTLPTPTPRTRSGSTSRPTRSGAGAASARHDWDFRPGEAALRGAARRAGQSGRPGWRCFTVPFGWAAQARRWLSVRTADAARARSREGPGAAFVRRDAAPSRRAVRP